MVIMCDTNKARIYLYKEFPELSRVQVFLETINNIIHVCVGPKNLVNDVLKRSVDIKGRKVLISLYADNEYQLTKGHRTKIDEFFAAIKRLKMDKKSVK
jgi:hypothetical protein